LIESIKEDVFNLDYRTDESTFPGIWLFCFEEAWEAYCQGSIPIGAVITDAQGRVIAKGRNRFFEKEAEAGNICWNRLAHAEINAMLKVSSHEHPELKSYTLYTTVEPCVQCFGALYMSNIGNLKYAAKDKIAGGVIFTS
jgi:tRNA(adenine34) deaminase